MVKITRTPLVASEPIELPASKSELNRFLLLAAIHPGVTQVMGTNACDDVRHLLQGLETLGVHTQILPDRFELQSPGLAALCAQQKPIEIDCGESAAVFRFLFTLATLRIGQTYLRGSSRLLSRIDQETLHRFLNLGVSITPQLGGIALCGAKTWPDIFEINAEQTSQWNSALALVASGFERPTKIIRTGNAVSEPYWKLTLHCLQDFRILFEEIDSTQIVIQPNSIPPERRMLTEGDTSCGAVWLAAKALGLPVELANYPTNSRQADTEFLSILEQFNHTSDRKISLRHCPDLAPVLTALASMSPGTTEIFDAAHLRQKESNRIEELARAFSVLGIQITPTSDGLWILGNQIPQPGRLDPQGDHRIAMAASLFAIQTPSIEVTQPACVNKSYPNFWEDAVCAGFQVEYR